MTLETILVSALAAATSTKVYPIVKEEKAPLPAIVYRRISYVPNRTQSGTADLKEARFQIDIYASTYRAVRELAELTKTFFEVNKTNWELSYIVNEQELTEDFLYRVILDVKIQYK